MASHSSRAARSLCHFRGSNKSITSSFTGEQKLTGSNALFLTQLACGVRTTSDIAPVQLNSCVRVGAGVQGLLCPDCLGIASPDFPLENGRVVLLTRVGESQSSGSESEEAGEAHYEIDSNNQKLLMVFVQFLASRLYL